MSVIVVARNQQDTIASSLRHIFDLDGENREIIVVDDCSQDSTPEIAAQFPVKLARLERQGGAAAARNHGARLSSGEVLFFLDSDVAVARNALTQIAASFEKYPRARAIQGAYSDESGPKNFATVYRDHFNAYKNQEVPAYPVTVISTYCFAIKRDTFFDIGGFDPLIPGATVEDNDLGYRLFASGNQVVLDRELKVTHLKRYTLAALLRRDYAVTFQMAKLFFRSGPAFRIPLSSGPRVGRLFAATLALAPAAFALAAAWAYSGFTPLFLAPLFLIFCVFFLLHRRYLASLSKSKGLRFCAAWTGFFYLNMLCASLGLLHGTIDFFIFRKRY